VGRGVGFEVVFRLEDDAALDPQAEPPMWVVSPLVNLAKYVFSSGNRFRPGHHLPTSAPISLATPDSLLRPEAGEYRAGDSVIRVVQSVIRDPEGNVVEVVG